MKRYYQKSWFRYLAPLPMMAQMLLMLFMAIFGRPDSPGSAPDWSMHLTAYAVLTFFIWLTITSLTSLFDQKHTLRTVTFIAVSFALFDEIIQHFSPSRAAQLSDLFMDLVGICLIMLIIRCVQNLFKESAS